MDDFDTGIAIVWVLLIAFVLMLGIGCGVADKLAGWS